MELLQLRYFMIVAEMEHLSNAATKLHIAQPALSQTIHRLENELGTTLFDRRGRGIYLNDKGRILLKYSKRIFQDLDAAKTEIADMTSHNNKTVRLALGSASMLLPDMLNQIATKDSEICMKIYMNNADCDLFINSSFSNRTRENAILLLEEDILLAIPKGHPFAFKKTITKDDLKILTFISLSETNSLYNILEHYLSENNISLNIEMYIDNPSILRKILQQGNYVAFIPSITWNNFSEGALISKRVEGLEMKRSLFLSWNDKKYLSKSVLLCKDVITEYFKNIRKM